MESTNMKPLTAEIKLKDIDHKTPFRASIQLGYGITSPRPLRQHIIYQFYWQPWDSIDLVSTSTTFLGRVTLRDIAYVNEELI